MTLRLAWIAFACVVLSACSSGIRPQTQSGLDHAVTRTASGIDDAALTPLNDLNLVQVPIPERLERIKSPYEPLQSASCASIAAEVEELTIILGEDVDAPAKPKKTDSERAGIVS